MTRINVYLAGHESDLTAWLGRYGADVDCSVVSATRGAGDVRDVVVLDVASADADFVCEALQNDGSVITYCVEDGISKGLPPNVLAQGPTYSGGVIHGTAIIARWSGLQRIEAQPADPVFTWFFPDPKKPPAEHVRFECRIDTDTPCPACGRWALVRLPPPLRDVQTDGTTHVCHPAFGGCNRGFGNGGATF
jgi:hypothetical protein